VTDLSADLGFTLAAGHLGDLLDIVSTVSVPFGSGADDSSRMRAACAASAAKGVLVGLRLAYPRAGVSADRRLEVDLGGLTAELVDQVDAFDAIAQAEGAEFVFVKPHGALYDSVVHDKPLARAVLAAVLAKPALALFGPRLTVLAAMAALECHCSVDQALADRRYTPSGSPVPIGSEFALIADARGVVEQARRISQGEIVAIDGSVIHAHAISIGMSVDSPHGVQCARAVRAALEESGDKVQSFQW
jgi:UPF0271 protein